MQYLHTMIRVVDLDRSIEFYSKVIGLKLQKRKDYVEGKFTLAFLGIDETSEPFLELTHNWDTKKYELGNGFGHIALGVTDIYKTCEAVSIAGGKITRPPGPMKFGTSVIAFCEDPDGYKIELIQR